jgi:hypothetical protein
MYKFCDLVSLYNNINSKDTEYFKNKYILNNNNKIDEEHIIIYHIYNKMNMSDNRNNFIYIFTPLIFILTIILGFKQFIYMIY